MKVAWQFTARNASKEQPVPAGRYDLVGRKLSLGLKRRTGTDKITPSLWDESLFYQFLAVNCQATFTGPSGTPPLTNPSAPPTDSCPTRTFRDLIFMDTHRISFAAPADSAVILVPRAKIVSAAVPPPNPAHSGTQPPPAAP